MNHIVVIFHPFDLEQEVMVYQYDRCIEVLHPCLDDTVKTVCGLNKQYHANKIELCGSPSFVTKYVKELRTDFSNDMPTIEIIQK